MTALHGNYTGTLGPNGAQGAPGYPFHYNGGNGGNGSNGVYALNIGGTQIGGGTYLPPGTYTSYGQIQGGAGGSGGTGGSGYIFGYGGTGGTGGAGGVGVDLSSGTLINNNTITGGAGGTGGNGGYGYAGGTGGPGSAGGAGVYLNGGTLSNAGLITGGSGGNGGNGGNNGNSGAVYVNSGEGGSGGNGGAGVDQTDGTLTNSNHITGGNGGNGGHIGTSAFGGAHGYYGANGGTGGAGVDLSSGTVTNTGVITGGNGGSGLYAYYRSGNGGNGGAGLNLNGGTATNSINGLIQGGNGGTGGSNYNHAGNGGQGGAGVYLNGGTLTTSGTISGGQGGQGGTGFFAGANGANGDAVQFGTVASTLVVKPHAVFNGQVAANASVNGVLKLSGTQSGGTPITLGTQFTGFSTLAFNSGAAWTVDVGTGAASSNPGLAIGGFTTSDTIDVTNLNPTQAAADFNASSHVLTTASDGTLNFSGPFSGEYFLFSSDGGTGANITVVKGSGISTTVTSTVTLGSRAHPSPLTITSTGVVSPTVAGAMGVLSNISGNSLTNNGAIHGGAGSNSSVGGIGGMGVNFKSGTALTNTSSITGGTGGSGSSTTGGTGGAGVNLLAGTLTNSGSITGGTGGAGTTTGGHGGAGVDLNGGTLITSGTISGGQGGTGATTGAAGDAVQFGTVASTLIVDPGAIFNGQVVADASAPGGSNVLELAGTQSGGTAITLGTQFTNFSTLTFASGAAWTADATKADLIAHPLTIDGFTTSDTLDITNLAKAGTTSSFNTTTDVLTLTHGTTVINLDFNSSVNGDHFVLTANGAGTDVTVQPGPAATFAASGHDLTNFVGDEHRALMGDRVMLGAHAFGSGLTLHTDPAIMASGGHGISSDPFTDHGIAHASVMLR